MNETLALLNDIVAKQVITVTLVLLEAAVIIYFIRNYTQAMKESNAAIVAELKHTIQTMKQLHQECSEERKEAYLRLSERTAKE